MTLPLGAVTTLVESGVQGLDQELVRTTVEIYAPALPLTPAVSAEGILTQHRLFPARVPVSELAIVFPRRNRT
jgi:hypothetical protein